MNHITTEPTITPKHDVIFYGNDVALLSLRVAAHTGEGLMRGDAAIIVATAANAEAFRASLSASNIPVQRCVDEGRLVFVDADVALAEILVDGLPDPARFAQVIETRVEDLAARFPLHAYGEMVGILWEHEQRTAALALEECWNALQRRVPFELLCAYPVDIFHDSFTHGGVSGIMVAHDRVVPSKETFGDALDHGIDRVLGQQSETIRRWARRDQPSDWAALDDSSATILWLRRNRPANADAVLRYAQDRLGMRWGDNVPVTRSTESSDQERLALLVRAGEIFHQSLDVNATLNNVARLAVGSFSDICLFDLIDERSDHLFVTASAHRDASRGEALSSVASILYVEEFGTHPVVQVTRTGEPFFLPHIDEETLVAHAASRQHAQYMRRFDYKSKIVVPVVAQEHIFGALTFVRTKGSPEFDRSDLLFAIELGRRAGLAVANAKLFHREQHVAETLQRAFLPVRFPVRQGLEISAHYRPGSTEAAIGGDWYDAFETEDGRIVVTIGDVTGKGIEAARLMVLMRQAIRTAALDHTEPREIAAVCNRLLLCEEGDRLASAFIGILDAGTRTLRYVSAGHAPPLLRHSGAAIERLESPSPPLGAFRDATFEQYEIFCPEESMLMLYTDGVIEASHDVVAGEKMLEQVLASDAVLHCARPAEFIERAIGHQAPRDDIAIMVLNFARPEMRWQVEAEDARSAYTMREEYFRSLRELCHLDHDTLSSCGLIFAELIGNAVRHAPGPLSISLELRGEKIVLHVIDRGSGFNYEPALPSNLWSESGRGLFLISRLAPHVQVERIPGLGSHVAVTLPASCK